MADVGHKVRCDGLVPVHPRSTMPSALRDLTRAEVAPGSTPPCKEPGAANSLLELVRSVAASEKRARHLARTRNRYERNRRRINARRRELWKAKADAANAKRREHYRSNAEKVCATARAKYQIRPNREAKKERQRRHYAKNRKLLNARARDRYAENRGSYLAAQRGRWWRRKLRGLGISAAGISK